MATARAEEPVLLDPQGPVITAIACAVGAALFLGAGGACGYVVARTRSSARAASGGRGSAPGSPLLAAFVASVGWSTVASARAELRATLQLAALGVDASALLLAVSSAPPSNDHHFQVRLSMRVSGPGFTPFECGAEVLRYQFGGATPGTVLPARVNPVTRVFTIERPPAPPAPPPVPEI